MIQTYAPPAGRVVVPVAPTEAMLDAVGYDMTAERAEKVWSAMLAAAPSTPDTRSADVPVGMKLIDRLRDQEADSVNILCDNPEGPPNNAVECCGFWTGFVERRFEGETLIAALQAAVAAKDAADRDGYPDPKSQPPQTADTDAVSYRAYTAGPLNDEPVEADFISAHASLGEAQAAVNQARKGGGWVWHPADRRLWRSAGRKTLGGPNEWEEMDAERLGVRKTADGGAAADGVLGSVLPAARSEVGSDAPQTADTDAVRDEVVEKLVVDGRAKKCSLNVEQRAAADDEARAFYRKVIDTYRAALSPTHTVSAMGVDADWAGDWQGDCLSERAANLARPRQPAELVACDWPADGRFTFHDEPGAHDPCYVVMPGGSALPLNHNDGEGVDVARAKFIVAACNAAIASLTADKPDTQGLREALEPFAKAGGLFAKEPVDPRYSVVIYRPAAGDEYTITDRHLRAAFAALSQGDR